MQRAEEVPLDFPATEKKRHGLRALLAGAGGKCVRDAGKKRPAVQAGGRKQYPRTAAAVIGKGIFKYRRVRRSISEAGW